MEDWQEWQIRADQVAADLGQSIETLEAEYLGEEPAASLRGFWPRFRDLKERVRVAPAIKLEDKLALERRLRTLGSRAYKAQEASFAESAEHKSQYIPRLDELRAAAEAASSPRDLRAVRRELGSLRKAFETDSSLVAADRQTLWDAWRSVNQFVWDRLNEMWGANEIILRDILASARRDLEQGNAGAVRQNTRRFFDALKSYEAKQESVNAMKTEAEDLRRAAEQAEEQRHAARAAAMATTMPAVNPVEGWRADLQRGRDSVTRLETEAADLEQQMDSADSILEQAMIRGTLVEKRRKITELERANRSLEQRIEQSEEVPLIQTH